MSKHDGDVNLEAIARDRVDRPLNEWPDHTAAHDRTLMGAHLFDYACLRCWLERIATEKLKQKNPLSDTKDLAS